jgi:YVTN family beta-propeller protein
LNNIEIHLILNHIPILGVAFVSLYLLIATIFKNTFMQKVSLWILLGVALLTIAVYLSGLGAETPVESLSNVSKVYLQLHEKVARISSMTIWAIGGITVLGLVFLRRKEQLFKYFVRGILAMTLLSTGLFILTGYLGGQITHSEIRSTLAEGLSTRSITLGVVAILLVIVIAMIVPLVLHRSQFFEKVGNKTLDGSAAWQGQQQHGEHSSWGEDGATSLSPSRGQSLQQASANAPSFWSAASTPVSQSLNQPSTGASLPLLSEAPVASERQSPPAQFQKIALSQHAGNTPVWPNYRPQGFGSEIQGTENGVSGQLTFSSSQLQSGRQSRFEQGYPRVQEDRPLIEENTKPLPQAVLTSKRLKGRKKLLVALSLLGVVLLMGSLGFVVIHKLKPAPLPLQIIADIPLTGGANRFDYTYLDPHTRLLYLTHSASNTLIIFDTVSRKRVADIPGIPDVHAVAVAPDLGRVFATSATANQVVVIDAHTYSITARIPVGDGPDGLIYDQADHKVFVADEAGQTDAVIDARTEQRIAEIPLGGDAGDIEYDAVSHRIFAVVATLNQLVTIDPVTDKIIARSALPGCQGGQDLVLDEIQRLALVDCADNAALLLIDMPSMRVISTQSVGKNPDLMALDSGWHYLYVASESGVVSVFDEHGRALKKVNEGYVAPGSHSVAADQETHYMYLPLQNVGGRPILRIALLPR